MATKFKLLSDETRDVIEQLIQFKLQELEAAALVFAATQDIRMLQATVQGAILMVGRLILDSAFRLERGEEQGKEKDMFTTNAVKGFLELDNTEGWAKSLKEFQSDFTPENEIYSVTCEECTSRDRCTVYKDATMSSPTTLSRDILNAAAKFDFSRVKPVD